MKKIMIASIALTVMFSSINAIADSKKSSAMKVSKSGEAMSKKSSSSVAANRSLANSKKAKKNKLASK